MFRKKIEKDFFEGNFEGSPGKASERTLGGILEGYLEENSAKTLEGIPNAGCNAGRISVQISGGTLEETPVL